MTSSEQGKVVAITGAGSGMGEADALLLGTRGDRVVLGDLDEDRLTAVAERIEAAGGTVAQVQTDVRRKADLDRLVALAVDRFGRLDVLINNAGVMPIGPLDDLHVDAWDLMIDVNVKGVLYGIAAALPQFRRQGHGHIVNMGSTAAHLTVANQAVYSGTKFAVRAITEGLRQEAGDTIRVTLISPGFVRTNFAERVTNTEVKARLEASRDRFAMPPEAVAKAIAFAVDQPADIDVGEIIIRATAQP
jgi:NADP-dependent 3-hydroxy acid dehydrogenase YdfG